MILLSNQFVKQHSSNFSEKSTAKPGRRSKADHTTVKAYSIPWTVLEQREIDREIWSRMQIGEKLGSGYGTFFKGILQNELHVTCKLKPLGFKRLANGKFYVRFMCTIASCKRLYTKNHSSVQCKSCKRWTHRTCLGERKKHELCVICCEVGGVDAQPFVV